MNGEQLFEAIGRIDDRFIAQADEERRAARPVWVRWAAAAACVAIVLALSSPWLLRGMKLSAGAGQNDAAAPESAESSSDTESGAAPNDGYGGEYDSMLKPIMLVTYDGRIYEAVESPYDGAPPPESAAGEPVAQAQADSGEPVALHRVRDMGEALLAGRFEDGWRYLLFCNYIETGTAKEEQTPMRALLALYGVESAQDIAAIETTDWNRRRVTGSLEDRGAIEDFYDSWSGLTGFGNDEFQARVFGAAGELEQQRVSQELAEDLTVVRIRLTNGLSIWLNCYADFGYFDQNMVYFELPQTLRALLEEIG